VPGRARTRLLRTVTAMAEAVEVESTAELLVGCPPAQIALLADELDADLVVIGSRHMSGIKRFLLGSTSRALIGETSRPVLVISEVALEPAAYALDGGCGFGVASPERREATMWQAVPGSGARPTGRLV
jgi:hypothetical protein